MSEQQTSTGRNGWRIALDIIKYTFYSVTTILTLLALFKTATGVNPFESNEMRLKTQKIEVKRNPTYNAETKTIGETRGTLTITGSEVQRGYKDLTYVLVLRYSFSSASDTAKGYKVLDDNLTFKMEDGTVLGEYLLNESADQSLIDQVNRSVLPTKAGETVDLAAVFNLDQVRSGRVLVFQGDKQVDEIRFEAPE